MVSLANLPAQIVQIATRAITINDFSTSIYGEPSREINDLIEGIRKHGILVPLVVHAEAEGEAWELISGHRRLACARELDLPTVPCVIRTFAGEADRRHAILEYNRQRPKTFGQMMREADAMVNLFAEEARDRSLANLCRSSQELESSDCRNSDVRSGQTGRTDSIIAPEDRLGWQRPLSSSSSHLEACPNRRPSSGERGRADQCRDQDGPCRL